MEKLPSTLEIWEKSRIYAYEECCLQNFHDEDEITVMRGHYLSGYQQAIRDYIDKNYNWSNAE